MACNCEIYTCLPIAPQVLQCGEGITTSLLATETTTYTMQYEFNNRWFSTGVGVIGGQPIEIPNVFNEQYTHTLKFYDAGGALVNDTCYTLDSSMIPTEVTPPASPSAGDGGLTYITVTAQEGNTIPFILGTPVIIMDGNQSYIDGQFTYDGITITMNTVSFYDGQIIGIFYEQT